MSETPSPDAVPRREELKASVQTWAEDLKSELARVVDQKLDELGARIGG